MGAPFPILLFWSSNVDTFVSTVPLFIKEICFPPKLHSFALIIWRVLFWSGRLFKLLKLTFKFWREVKSSIPVKSVIPSLEISKMVIGIISEVKTLPFGSPPSLSIPWSSKLCSKFTSGIKVYILGQFASKIVVPFFLKLLLLFKLVALAAFSTFIQDNCGLSWTFMLVRALSPEISKPTKVLLAISNILKLVLVETSTVVILLKFTRPVMFKLSISL